MAAPCPEKKKLLDATKNDRIHARFLGDGLFLRVPKRRRHANRAKMLVKSGITFFLRVPKRRRHANRAKMLEISKLGF